MKFTWLQSFNSRRKKSSGLIAIRRNGEFALVADLLGSLHIEPFAKVEKHSDVTIGAPDEPEAFLHRLHGTLLAPLVRDLDELTKQSMLQTFVN